MAEVKEDILDKVLDILIRTQGSLGFSQFRLHSIRPNKEEEVYYVKYSFIPRGQTERIYYILKANTSSKDVISLDEITKEKAIQDDN